MGALVGMEEGCLLVQSFEAEMGVNLQENKLRKRTQLILYPQYTNIQNQLSLLLLQFV